MFHLQYMDTITAMIKLEILFKLTNIRQLRREYLTNETLNFAAAVIVKLLRAFNSTTFTTNYKF